MSVTDGFPPAPVEEPNPVEDIFVTNADLDGTAEYVRLTGMTTYDHRAPSTRIKARLVMPASVARKLDDMLRQHFRRYRG